LIALGFIGVSTVMAGRFGYSLGSTETDRWLYAAAGALADILKALLPLFIVAAWFAGQYVRSLAAALLFVVFTGYSLASSFGLAAIQRAEKLGDHAAVARTYQDRRAELERHVAERGGLPAFRPTDAAAEEAARIAVEREEASVKAECERRGPRCRELEAIARAKRDELARISADLATSRKAAELDAKIAAAREKLGGVDVATASREADPQAAALARLVRLAVNVDDKGAEDLARTALHAVIAILLELGSGLGLYVVFGHHGGATPAREGAPSPEPHTSLLPAPSGPRAVSDAVVIEGPADAIARFVLERVRPTLRGRVSGAAMYAAYVAWCEEQGLTPVSATTFGRCVPWRKDRVGGRVWYLDAALVEDAAVVPLRLVASNTAPSAPRPGNLAPLAKVAG
jgi:hypothetical protein